MKRHGNLWEKIISKENLQLALDKAKRNNGKKSARGKRAIAKVVANREEYINRLHELLKSGGYHTSEYRTRRIYEPKERLLYILPFYPDRIVHHAIMNVLEPIWDGLMYAHSYSCRKGKGQHAASRKCMGWVNQYRYVFKGDCSKFYPSMRHDVAKRLLRKKLKDRKLLALLDEIIDSIEGETNIPIGNYLSQWLGNLYLNELDTFVKQKLGTKRYVRYCDDFILFSNSKKELNAWAEEIKIFLSALGLKLSKADVFPVTRGLDFLGYRHFPKGKILLRKSTAKRFKKRVMKLMGGYHAGKVSAVYAQAVLGSTRGWLRHAQTYNFTKNLKLDESWQEIRKDLKKMKGFPKHLNTREDYEYIKANFPEEKWKPEYQLLLDSEYAWFFVQTLDSEDAGVTDATHKVVTEEKMDGEGVIYQQYEYRVNPTCKLLRLGFTHDEVAAAIG